MASRSRSRTPSPAQIRNAYFGRHGSTWSLTGSLMGSTLLYMGLYLLVAAGGVVAANASGLTRVVAGSGIVALLPFFVLLFVVSSAMSRAIGHVTQELALGAIMMLVVSPFLGMALAYGLAASPAAVLSASVAAGGSVVVTAAIAFVSPWDLTKLSGLALVGLVGLLITELLAMVLGAATGLVLSPLWSMIGIAVFELYLVVDFSRMRQAMAYGPNDGLAAYLGLNLALDVVNLFLYFLMLFVGGSRR